ncbi:MAG: glycosyltransferase family protein [Planctomycetota bacterium]
MARILYAASGDGYGHAVRAHGVGAGLLARGHDVRFLSCDKTTRYLEPHYPDRLHHIFGLFTVYNQGRVEPWQTLVHNARRAWSGMGPSNQAVKSLLRSYEPDLVITDFEPFAAFWARRFGIPYVSLDNQHLLTHCEVDHPPGFWRDIMNAYLTVRLYYGGAKRYLITTFIQAPIRYHPTTLVNPILRPHVYAKQPRDGGFLLAYKGAGGENDAMREELEKFDRLPIRAYGFGIEGRRKHVEFRPIEADAFLDDLAGCAGVVTSAGHSLVCECLHFEKPMLLIPIAQQYEQILNARHVEKLGAGKALRRLTGGAMDEFIDGLDGYRASMSTLPKASIHPVLDAIEREIP